VSWSVVVELEAQLKGVGEGRERAGDEALFIILFVCLGLAWCWLLLPAFNEMPGVLFKGNSLCFNST
jgi:hypothetical protein